MRGRCERHQLALGPSGCLLCRRETATLPNLAAPVNSAADLPGADQGGVPVTAGSASEESAAPRRVSVQVPGFVLLLPLVAAAFYFFAFFAGDESTGAGEPGAALVHRRGASAPPPSSGQTPPAASAESMRSSFQTVVIEEPGPSAAQLDSAPPGRAASAAARSDAASARLIASARKEAEARELAEMRKRVDVVVYSTAWCPACRSLRDYLARRGIRATEHDIERNRAAQARQRELNPRGGVPTVEIDGQVLVGFSPKSIEAALDRAARARQQRL